MNKNLILLLNTLLSNKNILEEFLSKEKIDDLYEFCLSIVDGYTFEEFKEFLNTLAKIDYDFQNSQEISDDNLANVAGGLGMPTKMTAALMSSVLLLGSSGIGAHGLSNNNTPNSQSNNTSISQNTDNKQKYELKNNNLSQEQKENFQKIINTARKFTNSENMDSNENTKFLNSNNENNNKSSKLSIAKYPVASSITYGQKLSESILSGGKSNYEGTFSWLEPSLIPNAGEKSFKVKFTPNDNNLKPEIIEVNVNVSKAKPVVSSWPTSARILGKYAPQQTYFSEGKANIGGNFSWGKILPVVNSNQNEYVVTFIPNDTQNYETVSKKVPINISNTDVKISWPKASNLIYGQKLSESKLLDGISNVAGRFEWDETYKNSVLAAGTHSCRVVFKPYNTQKYKPFYQYININVNKAVPKLLHKPTASKIVYGQTLNDSILSGGKFNIEGSFSWADNKISPSAGIHLEKVIFKPKDTKNYEKALLNMIITVKRAPSTFISAPYASEITYGESLGHSDISNFITNVPGKICWENSDEILDAGTHKKTIVFRPYDSDNYENAKIYTQVRVRKAQAKLTTNKIRTAYRERMTANHLKLPAGWVWDMPGTRLDRIGHFNLSATYHGDKNHLPSKSTFTITVMKADPKLSLPTITYRENQKLKDIPLPKGWHWNNENEIPTVDKSAYKANFNAKEGKTNFYNSKNNVSIVMNVQKAEPKIHSWPKPTSAIVYGDDLGEIRLTGGKSEIGGSFRLLGDTNDLKAGERKCTIVFKPTNPNYKEISREITIKILKNMTPAESPEQIRYKNAKRTDTSISFDIKEGRDPIEFSKDGGKTWQDSPTFTDLSPNTRYTFVHRYKDTKSRCAGKISKPLKIATKDSAPAAPKKIRLVSYTNHEIILKKTPWLEFSIDGGKTWQDSCEFKNLESKTEYRIVTRMKESKRHVAGKISTPLVITTRSWLGNLWHKIIS